MKEFDNSLNKKFDFEFDVPSESEVDIEKLKKFVKSEDVLIFYGGEPLVNMEKMFEIIDALPNQKYCMQTNGKLLNKVPKTYMSKFSKILVSIDGNKERTDYNRGEGTYDLVLKNIDLIRERGFKGEIVARMTLDNEVGSDIYEQVRHLIDLKKFDSVHWQLDAGFYKFDFNEKFSEFVEKYNKSISKLIDYWVQEMYSGRVLKIYPFVGIFNDLYYGTKSRLRCGAGYAGYCITTNSKIVACPIMNNIKNFYCGDLDSDSNELKEIGVIEPCKKCEYLDLCGGRCLYSNYAKLWPSEGQKLICKTIIHLIENLRKKVLEIKRLIESKVINEEDFKYEKYFGPEIIP